MRTTMNSFDEGGARIAGGMVIFNECKLSLNNGEAVYTKEDAIHDMLEDEQSVAETLRQVSNFCNKSSSDLNEMLVLKVAKFIQQNDKNGAEWEII